MEDSICYLLGWLEIAALEVGLKQPPSPAHPVGGASDFFFISIFFKKKLQKYIFGFTFYSFIPLPPARGQQGPTCK